MKKALSLFVVGLVALLGAAVARAGASLGIRSCPNQLLAGAFSSWGLSCPTLRRTATIVSFLSLIKGLTELGQMNFARRISWMGKPVGSVVGAED